MAGNEVTIRILAKDDASKTFHAVEKSAGGLGKAFSDVGKIAGGFLAAGVISKGFGALTGGISSSIALASSFNESLSKTRVVFGESSKAVEAFASTAAKSLGMSKGATLEATSTFGNFLQAMGASKPAAQDMSIAMVKLAADLASFNNANPEEVLLALRSGLSGEAEPMRRFGVALSETAVKAQLAKMGIKALGGEFTEAQKIQARYAIIMEQTAMAQGDFARTSDGLANKQRIAAASMDDLKTKIGQGLLPVQLALTTAMTDKLIPAISKVLSLVGPFITAIREGSRHLDNWRVVTEGLPAPLRILAQIIGETIRAVVTAFSDAKAAFADLRHFFELGLEGGKIGGDLAIIQEAAFKVGGVFRDDLIPAFDKVKEALHLFMVGLKGGDAGGELSRLGKAALTAGQALGPFLDALAGIKTEIIIGIATAIGVALVAAFIALGISATAAAIGVIAATAPILAIPAAIALAVTAGLLIIENWDAISAKASELGATLRSIWETEIPEPIRAFLGFIAGDVTTRIAGVKDVIVGIFNILKDALQAIWALIHGDWRRVWEEIKSIAGRVPGLIISALEAAFGALPGRLYNIGVEAGRRLVAGIMSGASGRISIAGININPLSMLRQHGGPVSAGSSYIVGERGPELFVPRQSGAVVPSGVSNGINSGGGASIVVNVYGSILSEREVIQIIRDALRGGGFRGLVGA